MEQMGWNRWDGMDGMEWMDGWNRKGNKEMKECPIFFLKEDEMNEVKKKPYLYHFQAHYKSEKSQPIFTVVTVSYNQRPIGMTTPLEKLFFLVLSYK